jgi:hypothetical protein
LSKQVEQEIMKIINTVQSCIFASVLLCSLVQYGTCFVSNTVTAFGSTLKHNSAVQFRRVNQLGLTSASESEFSDAFMESLSEGPNVDDGKILATSMKCVTSLAAGLSFFASQALADVPGGEMVDLPPPYVPVLFAVVILGGVGFLTSSLGDVISDGKTICLIPCGSIVCFTYFSIYSCGSRCFVTFQIASFYI